MLYTTPSQTVGPYLHIGLDWLNNGDLVRSGQVSGEVVHIEGVVRDAHGEPVPDGMIEIWQANAHGKYAHPDDLRALPVEPGFSGFGRLRTDAQGRFAFVTIRPGAVPGADGVTMQAPHIAVSVFARGVLKRLATRIYFGDAAGEAAHAVDPVLALVPVARRATLIAKPQGNGRFSWDVRIRGADETVFFDV